MKKGFSAAQILTLSQNGAITDTVLGLWGAKSDSINVAWDLYNEEKRARFLLLIIGLTGTVVITALTIFFYLTAADDVMLRRGVIGLIIVDSCLVGGLAATTITLALKVNRSWNFERKTGQFGYEYAALIDALSEVGREWVDATWTAGKIAQSSLEALQSRVAEVLHKRAAALEAAEEAQRAKPDSVAYTTNVERERAAFKEGFRVFVRFTIVDKSLGWTPYFPKS